MTTPSRKSVKIAAAVLGAAVLASAFAAPAQAAVLSPDFISPTAGAKQINIVGFNDFHGRFLNGEKFAASVFEAQKQFGEANSLVISNGDAVGASLFESSIQQDQPTLDVLNAIGVDTWTQGNHEFDKGIDDATGRLASATNGSDLAANVTRADGSYPFETHKVFTIDGVKVAIIGAVTQETGTLVSPDGIAGISFGNPVAAVNRVAAELKDGNAANGEADVIVASYHEGGPVSGGSLAENEESATFRAIAQDTAPTVDAIFNAHTHNKYAYDAPIGAKTRPIIQAGQYAENLAQVVLTVDASNAVTASDSSIVPVYDSVDPATVDPESPPKNPAPAEYATDARITALKTQIDAARAEADVLGAEVIGNQQGDVSRGKVYEPGTLKMDETGMTSGGVVKTADNRADESSLGGMIAQSMQETINATGRFTADAAIINPGGIRADLLDDDGKITYKEAATVLPFANNLSVVSISGAELKNVLEEQWQLAADGSVPSRAYLQLGLSDNFTYAYDGSRDRMSRIVEMTIDGQPVAADKTYKIAMPTFLAAGGDNFHSLKNRESVADTGLIDLDAFVEWIRAETAAAPEGVTPDTRRNGIEVIGLPANSTYQAGQTYTLTVKNFNLSSLGFIQNSKVSAWLGETEIGSGVVDVVTNPNSAELTFTIPADAAVGAASLTILTDLSAASIALPVTTEAAAVTPTPTATAEPTPTPPITVVPGDSDDDNGSDDKGTDGKGTNADGDKLATTGADETALFAGIAAALALLVGGAATILLRRRAGSDA